MSNKTMKHMRPTLRVTRSPRSTLNQSASGILRVTQSGSKTTSVNAFLSRKTFSLAGDSKVLDKSSVQTPKHIVQVFDDTGKDATPQPLYQSEPGVMPPKQGKIFAAHDTSVGSISEFLSTAYQTTNASFVAPFTRSVFGSSTVSRSSQSTIESMSDEIEDPAWKRDVSVCPSDVRVWREELKEPVKEHMLDNVVDRYLTETETIWLLDMPALCVSEDSSEAEVVKERNSAYAELCKNRLGNDKYVERSMQTFNGAPKAKEVQSDSIIMVEKGTMATNWDMYDSYVSGSGAGEAVTDGERSTIHNISSVHHQESGTMLDKVSVSITSTGSTTSSRIDAEAFVVQVEDEPGPELVLQSEKFQQSLLVMERTVLENIYQPKLASYRLLPVLADPDSEEDVCLEAGKEDQVRDLSAPSLARLWTYSCELTMGRNVSSMAWNKRNPDLLAVGYGQFDFREQKSGLVCCWSLKNPTWPERIFHCESGVTALDFSSYNPSQLAVGMHDGSIAIYNVQSTEKMPVTDSSDCAQKHTDPVWQLRWVEQESGTSGEENGEALISVSADRRICKWFLRKGLDCIDLMTLKKMRNEKKPLKEGEKRIETVISRQAPGLCFDFHRNDPNIYLAGTEEGYIHKCSCSYNEQYLETYIAHSGPVYKISWSPFCPEVFLSCSADSTIQLWRQDLIKPVLAFTSTQKVVHDIMWSPRWSTVFGAVNEDRLEIWDLGESILDPTIISMAHPGVKLTSLLFASKTDCVLVGDSGGHVTVYKLENFTVEDGTREGTLEGIIRSSLVSQLREED